MGINQEDLMVEPYKLERMEQLEIVHEMNEHATMFLSGILAEYEEENTIHNTTKNTQIEIKEKKNAGETLFKGMVEEIQVNHIHGIYYVEIYAVSNTKKMDIKRKRASFQNKDLEISKLIKQITKSYSDADVIVNFNPNEKLEKFTMQYEETDWQFVKRLASRLHTCLIPYTKQDTIQYFVGIPKGKDRGELKEYNYTITKNITDCLRKKNDSLSELLNVDGICYKAETDEFFELGDQVNFYNKCLYVRKIATKLIKAEIKNTYWFTTRNGCSSIELYNDKITGLSIQGEVIGVWNDRIKLKLCLDQSQDVETAWEFPYATMYAAEGNHGFYFMPELGDTVLVYFPTKEESEGVGFQSIRTKNEINNKRLNPEVKYIRTKHGKELKLAPEEILITGLEDQIYIKLNDKTGIEIQSSKPIKMNTSEDMSFYAGKSMYLTAREEVNLTCRTSQIKLDENVVIQGKEIKNN